MNRCIGAVAVALAFGYVVVAGAAPAVKTYQATGPVVELSDNKIVIDKGKAGKPDLWEIARTADTKVTGDLKVGEKVTIEYTMTATTVEVKPAKAEAPKAPAKEKAEKK